MYGLNQPDPFLPVTRSAHVDTSTPQVPCMSCDNHPLNLLNHQTTKEQNVSNLGLYLLRYFILNFFSLCNLFNSSVTRNYFENLVRALENGLSDVDAHGGTSRTTGSRLGAGSSKSRTSRTKGTASTAKSSGSRTIDDSAHWSCEHCTFANAKSATVCQMCQQRR